jgi:hypothetical protein
MRVAVALGLAACSAGGDGAADAGIQPYPREGAIPARIAYENDQPLVEVPERAAEGDTVRVVVRTEGGGCIRKGETGITREGAAVDIRPLDVYPPRDAICTADYRLLEHEARFPAGAPGTLTVRIHGMRMEPAEGGARAVPVTISRSIRVD